MSWQARRAKLLAAAFEAPLVKRRLDPVARALHPQTPPKKRTPRKKRVSSAWRKTQGEVRCRGATCGAWVEAAGAKCVRCGRLDVPPPRFEYTR